MNMHDYRTPGKKSVNAAGASGTQQKSTGKAIHLKDNRPGSVKQQKKLDAMASRQPDSATVQKKENKTGLPDNLKSGIENLSGHSMDDVKVHYNSAQPAQLNAHAYAQGTDIHIAPGQEKHLPHEAWHVVQQKQGKVKPTMQMLEHSGNPAFSGKGNVNINDDYGLEKEADVMDTGSFVVAIQRQPMDLKGVIQRVIHLDLQTVPSLNSIVHIRSMTAPTRPETNRITGVNAAGDQAARHIIPQALIDRNFRSRFSGKTIAQLQGLFPHVVINNDYLINIAQAMQDAYSYENIQLNRGGGVANRPAGAMSDAVRNALQTPTDDGRKLSTPGDQASTKRNFWEGSQAGNLAKDQSSSAMLHTLAANSDNYFGNITPAAKMANPQWPAYQTGKINAIIQALAEEYDPPPFSSKVVIQSSAMEWARLTNEWLTNDIVSRSYYHIGRLFTWHDAVQFGNNATVYANAH